MKYYILVFLCALFLVPNDRIAVAAPISDELKMLIEISNNISSVKTELHNVDKKFSGIKDDFNALNTSIKDLVQRITVVEQWKISEESKIQELKALKEKVNELDKSSSTTDVKTSIYISIAGFLASAVITVLIGQFLVKNWKKK